MTTHLSDNKSQKALLQQAAILCVRGGTREELWGPQKFRDYGALWSPAFLAGLLLIVCHPSADASPCHRHIPKVAQHRFEEMSFP